MCMQDHLIGASKLRYMGRFRSTAFPDQGMYDEPRSWLVSADTAGTSVGMMGDGIGTGLWDIGVATRRHGGAIASTAAHST